MVEGMHLNDTLKKLFSLLGSFETQVEELAEAKSLASDYPNILSAITDLEKLGSFLRLYGIETIRLNSESSAITIIIPVLFLQDIHLEQENLW